MNKIIRHAFLGGMLACGLASCSKMDETYKEYLEGGEVIYTGRVDSVKAYSGYKRIELSWLLVSDPKITYCKVFWNNGADSLRVPIERGAGIDTINVLLENMEEGVYTFDIYTGDDQGHSSLKVSVIGRVYGDEYVGSLPHMPFSRAKWSEDTTKILWGYKEGNAILAGVELSYEDITGAEQRFMVVPDSTETVIGDFKKNTDFRYRTMYLPDSAAIDTFYTDYMTVVPLVEREMDKSLFAEYILPTDALTAYGWVLPALWDGSVNSPGGFHTGNAGLPHHYTFDLGVETTLSRFKVWQRGVTNDAGFLYGAGNLRKFEIWGATEPAADGSWAGWTKLLDCESIQPSGEPPAEVSDEDRAYAAAGEEFHFQSTVPPVRYIRVKVISNWGGAQYSHAMEMSFWNAEQ